MDGCPPAGRKPAVRHACRIARVSEGPTHAEWICTHANQIPLTGLFAKVVRRVNPLDCPQWGQSAGTGSWVPADRLPGGEASPLTRRRAGRMRSDRRPGTGAVRARLRDDNGQYRRGSRLATGQVCTGRGPPAGCPATRVRVPRAVVSPRR